jgi:hypothetical protein
MTIRSSIFTLAAIAAVTAIAGTTMFESTHATAQTGANQPLMQSALTSLISAKRSLTRAVPNKAGHRVAAMGYVDQAISEVQLGMAAAD